MRSRCRCVGRLLSSRPETLLKDKEKGEEEEEEEEERRLPHWLAVVCSCEREEEEERVEATWLQNVRAASRRNFQGSRATSFCATTVNYRGIITLAVIVIFLSSHIIITPVPYSTVTIQTPCP